MIEIDGSQGEGGGQVLRTALALSIITGEAVHISQIRAGRKKPGLAAQHLAGVIAAAKISRAKVSGTKVGSTEIVFEPGSAARSGDYFFDISELAGRGSAGAVTLLLQAILLPLALADGPTRVGVRGGTHVPFSPPVHFVEYVLLPALRRFGVAASIAHVQWGYYPVGGGTVMAHTEGNAKLVGADLTERGEVTGVSGVATASNLPSHIPQRIAARANNRLKELGLRAAIEPLRVGEISTGVGLSVAVTYENGLGGFSSLGERGKPSEAVADEALDALAAHHHDGAAVDPHLADQLLVAMALADGPSALTTSEITLHTLTNIAVIGHFMPDRFTVEGGEGQPGTLHVT